MHKVRSGKYPTPVPNAELGQCPLPELMYDNTHVASLTREAHSTLGAQTFHLGLRFVGMTEYVTKASL